LAEIRAAEPDGGGLSEREVTVLRDPDRATGSKAIIELLK
jgi:hypothetical protein